MKTNQIVRLVLMAMLTAIAIVLVIIVQIPPFFAIAPFLVYDMADVPILIGTMLFGVLPGLGILFLVSLIQAFLLGGNGWVGMLMHFVASGALVILVGRFHLWHRKWSETVIGMVLGTLAMTALMVGMNLVIDPLFWGMPYKLVVSLLVPAFIPFNLIKGGINCLLTGLLFKALTPFFRKNQDRMHLNM